MKTILLGVAIKFDIKIIWVLAGLLGMAVNQLSQFCSLMNLKKKLFSAETTRKLDWVCSVFPGVNSVILSEKQAVATLALRSPNRTSNINS